MGCALKLNLSPGCCFFGTLIPAGGAGGLFPSGVLESCRPGVLDSSDSALTGDGGRDLLRSLSM